MKLVKTQEFGVSLRELVLDQHDASSQQVYALLCPKSPETEKKPTKTTSDLLYSESTDGVKC